MGNRLAPGASYRRATPVRPPVPEHAPLSATASSAATRRNRDRSRDADSRPPTAFVLSILRGLVCFGGCIGGGGWL
jgi:hypothetical protein